MFWVEIILIRVTQIDQLHVQLFNVQFLFTYQGKIPYPLGSFSPKIQQQPLHCTGAVSFWYEVSSNYDWPDSNQKDWGLAQQLKIESKYSQCNCKHLDGYPFIHSPGHSSPSILYLYIVSSFHPVSVFFSLPLFTLATLRHIWVVFIDIAKSVLIW